MKKYVFILMCMLCATTLMAQDAMTGASLPVAEEDTVEAAKHKSGMDLTYTLVIANKTSSNYRITLDGHFLGRVAAKKKQEFKAQADWVGKLVAEQLDGYDIIPSKIIWTVPKTSPGSVVTFTINKK